MWRVGASSDRDGRRLTGAYRLLVTVSLPGLTADSCRATARALRGDRLYMRLHRRRDSPRGFLTRVASSPYPVMRGYLTNRVSELLAQSRSSTRFRSFSSSGFPDSRFTRAYHRHAT